MPPAAMVSDAMDDVAEISRGALKQNLYELNDHHDLVDSLAYVDPLNDEMQATVKELIEEEMQSMPKRNYLAPLPFPELKALTSDPLFSREMERIYHQREPEPLDVSRYELQEPSGAKANDLAEWKAAVENAQAQMENSSIRLMNLELMAKHAQNGHLKHIADLEAMDSA
eukprot:GHVU01037347.1.p1 GENE.GHVU01037347.1~~GHVU01037347.1.p1  ORF type:complete len:170 (+),score=33.11 GHVU01037347.1:650-1159(+)